MIKELLLLNLPVFLIAFIVTFVMGPRFIPWLHKLKFGQEIREEGPAWHQKKSGTPTMGGIMFIAGTAVVFVILMIGCLMNNRISLYKDLLPVFVIALGFGAVGFTDDYIKVVKKRNLGLTSLQKLLLQLVMTVIFVIISYLMGERSYEIVIPFTAYTLKLPIWIYIPFVMFVMVGTVNAVNLTDGLDGLATSVTIVVALFFMVMAWALGSSLYFVASAVAGSLAAFLVFNRYPAKVFMGDTGSLFLGGVIVLMAIQLKLELFLVIAGFVYFAETLSVIIQTSYFKYTKKKYGEGRRVFKMTPIHHHFEMCGWNEKKIVAVFTGITVVLCVIALLAGIPYIKSF